MGPKLGVGMPKRRKKKVLTLPIAATEPAVASAAAVTEKPPPASPEQQLKPSPTRAPPPSPGTLHLKELEAVAAKAARALRRTQTQEDRAFYDYQVALKVGNSKLGIILKTVKRKRKPIAKLEQRLKAKEVELELKEAELWSTECMLLRFHATAVLRDAQNAVLNSKLRRKFVRAHMWKPLGNAAHSHSQRAMQCKAAASPNKKQKVRRDSSADSPADTQSLPACEVQLSENADEPREKIIQRHFLAEVTDIVRRNMSMRESSQAAAQ